MISHFLGHPSFKSCVMYEVYFQAKPYEESNDKARKGGGGGGGGCKQGGRFLEQGRRKFNPSTREKLNEGSVLNCDL